MKRMTRSLLLLVFILLAVAGYTTFSLFCRDDVCFPQEDFPESYRDCGIIGPYQKKAVEVKECLWDSYASCQEAFAKKNDYGIEGQRISKFFTVEKKSGNECIIKWYLVYEEGRSEDFFCENLNKIYQRKNTEGEFEYFTCSDDCPPDYFLSDDRSGGPCQNLDMIMGLVS